MDYELITQGQLRPTVVLPLKKAPGAVARNGQDVSVVGAECDPGYRECVPCERLPNGMPFMRIVDSDHRMLGGRRLACGRR